MPTYEFQCASPKCAPHWPMYEIEFSIHSELIAFCKECGEQLVRRYTPIPAHFKGNGWGGTK